MKLLQLNLARRLLLGFGAVIALFAAVAALVALRAASAHDSVDRVDESVRILGELRSVGDNARENMVLVADLLVRKDAQAADRVAAGLAANRERNQKSVKALDSLVAGHEQRQALAALKERRSTFIAARADVVALVKGGQRDKAQQLYESRLVPVMAEYRKALEAMTELETRQAAEQVATAQAAADATRATLATGVALAMLAAALFGWLIARGIVRPLRSAIRFSESIAAGKLDNPIEVRGSGETAQLLCALQKMQAALLESRLEDKGQIAAIGKSQAVVEFALDGTVRHANDNFLRLTGYTLDEIRGQHHGMFVDPAERESAGYRAFWDKLARGEHDAGQYERLGKDGRELWLQASYNPILDLAGRPFKVVKYASDVTAEVRSSIAMLQTVEQTQALVAAAVQGDLTRRIELAGKGGALKKLAEGINALLDTTAGGIDEVVRLLEALARGDLTARIERDFHGSFGRLKADANATAEKLAETLRRIDAATETINGAAAEIASGNQDLSQRTEEQASSLEETAASMEELTTTVKQNADNARQANQLAATASDVAARGGRVVSQVVTTMSSITESSKKIADIIGVIDGIAFQTNILALNAAVEAARAGEQGRGFAVVASEVRNLAQRSAAAAREIKSLIGDSVEKVDAGSKLVEAAGKTMDDIVGSVKRVTDIMAEISAASAEQSAGIEQVNQAITQMDQATQQNAALVEQASAAAESMREQAGSMAELVRGFTLAQRGSAWDGRERRGPDRATNIARIGHGKAAIKTPPTPKPAAPAATGTDDDADWEQF